MKRVTVVLALALAPVLMAYGGCSSAGELADGTRDAGPDGSIRARPPHDATPPPTPPPAPEYNADGWLRLQVGSCSFYAAPTADKLPPPIQWEPCTGDLPSGLSCRQIKTDWPPASAGGFSPYMAAVNSAWVDTTTGRVLLPVNRFTGNAIYRVVGEADGPLHLAIVESGGACSLGTYVSIHDGHVVYTAGQDKSTSSGPSPVQYGAIGGALDDVPRVIRLATAGLVPDYYAGANAFFEWGGGLTVRSWTDGSSLAALSLSDPGDPGEPGFQGDALYFQVADLDYSRIKIYTPANGLRDLISYGNDVSHNAADFGTDGVDMLWVEGIGRSQGGIGQRFATYDIMTAPYTTDAATVQKRRLRSSLFGAFRGSPFSVGCGYAARDYEDETTQGLRVIRLSDGWSWKLQTEMNARYWQAPVAVTCSEVFVNTLTPDGFNLARVRLDSLGTGEPPD